MKITCPKCGAGIEEIDMLGSVYSRMSYNEKEDEFTIDTPESCEVQDVDCECSKCGHCWEWAAYRRNIKQAVNEIDRVVDSLTRQIQGLGGE